MLRGEISSYESDFECLECSEGCEECVDDRACMYSIYTSLRYTLLVINCLAILTSLVFAALIYKYWQNKVKTIRMELKGLSYQKDQSLSIVSLKLRKKTAASCYSQYYTR